MFSLRFRYDSFFSLRPCQPWSISLFPLDDLSERSTFTWSSGLFTTAVDPLVSARLKALHPNPTKCLLTWNLKSSFWARLLRMAWFSHLWRRLVVQWDHALCLCWKLLVRFISLPSQSCKVRRTTFFFYIKQDSCLDVCALRKYHILTAGPQCVSRRIYNITTEGNRSQSFVAVEGICPVPPRVLLL